MRILLVGAGGVGTALARIAARRPFAELVIADYVPARAAGPPGRAGCPRAADAAPLRCAHERDRPSFRDAAVPGRAPGRNPLPGHGHVAVPPRSGRPVLQDRREAG